MPATEPRSPENEKRGGGLWCIRSLEDTRKTLLRWERSPTALEAEAKALELEKPFSGSLNGDANKGFSPINGEGYGPYAFQLPVHYPRHSKVDYESMPEWQLDNLFHEYGLPIRGDLAFKWSYAMAMAVKDVWRATGGIGGLEIETRALKETHLSSVRKRPRRSFVGEIRDPWRILRVWLGTFVTAVEVPHACHETEWVLRGVKGKAYFALATDDWASAALAWTRNPRWI